MLSSWWQEQRGQGLCAVCNWFDGYFHSCARGSQKTCVHCSMRHLLFVAAPLERMVSYSYQDCKLSLAVLCLPLMACLGLAYATCFVGYLEAVVNRAVVVTVNSNHSHPTGSCTDDQSWLQCMQDCSIRWHLQLITGRDISGFMRLFYILWFFAFYEKYSCVLANNNMFFFNLS